MGRPGITASEIVQGLGEPDLQDDVLDSQQPMGLEHEERQLSEEQQLEQLDVLEGLRAMQSADPIRWKVYRYGQSDEKYNGYQCELNTGSLTQETIRKLLGGGSFKVRGFFPNGKYAAQRSVTIAGEPLLYSPQDRNNMQAPNQSGFNLAEFMTAQQRIDAQRRNEEMARAQDDEKRAERRAAENRQFILAIGAVVAPVITALVSRTAPAQPAVPAIDVAALANALKPATESPLSSMKGMLEVMTMMRELMPDGGGGNETVEMVKAVAGIAGPALQAFTQNRQPPVNVRPRVNRDPTQQPSRPPPVTIDAHPVKPTAVATPINGAPPQPLHGAPPVPGEQPTVLQASGPSQNSGVDLSAPSQVMTPGESTMFAQLKPQVDTLVQMARDGQDGKAVGEMFFDQFLTTVEDDMYSRLADLFEDPKTIDRMAIFNSGVKEFRPFFELLQKTVCEKIKQEEVQATIQKPVGENPVTDGTGIA